MEELCVFSYWEVMATLAGRNRSTFPAKGMMSQYSTTCRAGTSTLNAASTALYPSKHFTNGLQYGMKSLDDRSRYVLVTQRIMKRLPLSFETFYPKRSYTLPNSVLRHIL